MAKKLKKQKKGLSPKAKFTLVNVFKGLFSNQAVIDGSKASPWWVAAIFFVFSFILPLVPNHVKNGSVNGGAFCSSVNYGLDNSLTAFAYDWYKEGKELRVSKNVLHYYENDVETEMVIPDEEYIADYHEEYEYINSATHQVDLRVFVWGTRKDKKLSKDVTALTKQTYRVGSAEPCTLKEETLYVPNLLIVTPDTMAVALYKFGTKKQVAASNGGLTWYNTSTKVGLIERLLKQGIKDGVDFDQVEQGEYVNMYSKATMKQFVKICNETYLYQRSKTQWATTGIYAGIYAGIILFLGLMIFVLTRGKNNPFKYLNVWHCQKIAWWASASPAILGTILSLIFSTNGIGQMTFILLVSLRTMWLSMKQLRPVYQQ